MRPVKGAFGPTRVVPRNQIPSLAVTCRGRFFSIGYPPPNNAMGERTLDYNKKKEQDTWDEDEPDCPNRWMLQGFVVNTGSDISSTANVSLRYNGDGMETVAFGMGPIDAAFHAIENLVQSGAQLASYTIHSMSRGVDAQGEVIVQLERDGKQITGRGMSADIIDASIKAYLDGVNQLISGQSGEHTGPCHGK